jgi:E1A/CREB-binding protein
MSLEEATKCVESGASIIIRQVVSLERKLKVRDLMKKRYADKQYPDEFIFRRKCIVVFQRLDGVDVLLFAMYVYEHGADNPAPNTNVAYISYLDSVHFMRPEKLRTFVYREILVAYLDYVRQKGFVSVHVWACPPKEGDDYIFSVKPKDQKTPSDARLCEWYAKMLKQCQGLRICGRVTNMYDLYCTDTKLDATSVPYLEGDYFPQEAERIIKLIEEEKIIKLIEAGSEKKGGAHGKKKKKEPEKSSVVDGSGHLDSGDCDEVMVKLGEKFKTIEKESFIVAFLNSPSPHEGDVVAPNKFRLEHAAGSRKRAGIRNTSELEQTQRTIKVIDDDTEDLDCEFFTSRQEFLGWSRDNHCQFNELRRAKHSSMMLLWYLHKYIQESPSPPSVLVQADSNKENEVVSCYDDDNDAVGVKPAQPRMKGSAADRQHPDRRRGCRR